MKVGCLVRLVNPLIEANIGATGVVIVAKDCRVAVRWDSWMHVKKRGESLSPVRQEWRPITTQIVSEVDVISGVE